MGLKTWCMTRHASFAEPAPTEAGSATAGMVWILGGTFRMGLDKHYPDRPDPAFTAEAYDIPREQVVGSSMKLRYELKENVAELMKLGELSSFDDREVKPANIALHIGRRPILALGNSDGDLAMLRYCKTGAGARLALLIHHDDAEREVAYDSVFKLSLLVEALDKASQYGITVVSMKPAWRAVLDKVGARVGEAA
jgi:hypothetical protein